MALAFCLVSCAPQGGNDRYLGSLGVDETELVAVDSVKLGEIVLDSPADILPIDGDWVVMSLMGGDNHLLFYDTSTNESFFGLKKGRGPGEIVQGTSLHKAAEGHARFYDIDNGICVGFDLDKSVREKALALDTVCRFQYGQRPAALTSCGKGFVSGNLLDSETWYSYYDDAGKVISNVPALDFDELGDVRDIRLSFQMSSCYTSDPEGGKVCVASVMSPSLSFAQCKKGALKEFARIAFPPEGMEDGMMTDRSRVAFYCMKSDKDNVYVLYSGDKVMGGSLPAGECKHLVVYGWDGVPKNHYVLDKSICAFGIEGGKIVGCSSYPETMLHFFELPSE